MKTLKEFSLEWSAIENQVVVNRGWMSCLGSPWILFDTEEQASNWLEANGYIERTKEDET